MKMLKMLKVGAYVAEVAEVAEVAWRGSVAPALRDPASLYACSL